MTNKQIFLAQYKIGLNVEQVELKKLEDITDEDILKIAGLYLWQMKIREEAMIVQTREIVLMPSKVFTLKQFDWCDTIDKIRELGYAYRWRGISVAEQVKLGWVTLLEK